jgi:putative ATP-binding cassette transporter
MAGVTKRFLRDLWGLTWPYWQSEERWRSGGLLALCIVLNLGGVGLSVAINQWSKLFYNALQEKNATEFKYQLLRFCILASVTIIIAVYQTYLRQMLFIRWRRWLTQRYIRLWLAHRAYYRLQQSNNHADNPDQRIAEDIGTFINQTLSLGLDVISSLVTLFSFAAILWGLSGKLNIFGITLPGYMLFVAMVYAMIGSWLVAKVGWRLVGLNFQQQQVEANYRFSLVRVRENAEGIALYAGEREEARGLGDRFVAVVENWWGIMRQQRRLNWFSIGYAQIAVVFPFIVAAPRYFSGSIELGGLMQTASAFGAVQVALSWFITAFATLADWKARVDRLTSFKTALEEMGRDSEAGAAQRRSSPAPGLMLDAVDIWLPDGTKLIEGITLDLTEGSRTLITGASGLGKSMIFRVIAGLWPYCSGTLTFPDGERLLFLPQKPYLPIATLRLAVAYPDPPEAHSDAEYRDVLTACRLGHLADRLDEHEHWGQVLSGGEQQRLAVARALLFQPRWLFLDEATSNLEGATELPRTGLVSIAHHPALAAFHTRHLIVTRGEGKAFAHLSEVRLA